MFKASNDGGKTFGDKIDLSNTKASISDNAKIAAAGNNVYVTWWEHNDNSTTSDNQVLLRESADNGKTFGQPIILSEGTSPPSSSLPPQPK
jgi:hypothetical protein